MSSVLNFERDSHLSHWYFYESYQRWWYSHYLYYYLMTGMTSAEIELCYASKKVKTKKYFFSATLRLNLAVSNFHLWIRFKNNTAPRPNKKNYHSNFPCSLSFALFGTTMGVTPTLYSWHHETRYTQFNICSPHFVRSSSSIMCIARILGAPLIVSAGG